MAADTKRIFFKSFSVSIFFSDKTPHFNCYTLCDKFHMQLLKLRIKMELLRTKKLENLNLMMRGVFVFLEKIIKWLSSFSQDFRHILKTEMQYSSCFMANNAIHFQPWKHQWKRINVTTQSYILQQGYSAISTQFEIDKRCLQNDIQLGDNYWIQLENTQLHWNFNQFEWYLNLMQNWDLFSWMVLFHH